MQLPQFNSDFCLFFRFFLCARNIIDGDFLKCASLGDVGHRRSATALDARPFFFQGRLVHSHHIPSRACQPARPTTSVISNKRRFRESVYTS